MKKRFFRWLIIIFGVGLIIKLSLDIKRFIKAGDQVKQAEQKVQQLEEEQKRLKEKQEYYQSDEFVEEEARNKLNMAKPDESIVILPPNLSEVLGRQPKPATPEMPNWKKWWKLFF